MTLVQLAHLVALAEAGSFSKAAAAVFLTQPALSRSIRALEGDLGAPLLDRLGKRAELTPFGRDVLQQARHLLADAERLQGGAQRGARAEAGSLRLGLGSGPGALWMTPLLAHVARHLPELRLTVARGATGLLLQALRERRLDAAVLDARSVPPAADLKMDILHETAAAFMVRRGHPLARKRVVRFEQVRRFPVASTPLSEEVARVLVERYGPAAHPEECVTLCCDELPSLVQVAQESDAVLIAIRRVAPGLVELPMQPALQATARLGLVCLARRVAAPALPRVRELLLHHLTVMAQGEGGARA